MYGYGTCLCAAIEKIVSIRYHYRNKSSTSIFFLIFNINNEKFSEILPDFDNQ
jgi:hypothetical protein